MNRYVVVLRDAARLQCAVLDTHTQTDVFFGGEGSCKDVAASLNSGSKQEFEQLQNAIKAIIMALIRLHPLPWSVVDSGFGAEVHADDGTAVAFCTDGNEGLFVCRLARELEMEAEH